MALLSTSSRARLLLSAIALLAVTSAPGCYNPNIPSGAERCSNDGRCPEGLTCFPDKRCYKPGSNPTCMPVCGGQTPVCDKMTLKCVQCLTDKECPAGMLCVAQVCKPGCSAGHPACVPDAGACDVDLGVCRGCIKDDECAGGDKPKCDKPTGLCVRCLPADDQCPAGKYCSGADGKYDCIDGCASNEQCVKAAMAGSDDGGVSKAVTCCDKRCVDVGSDEANCGQCGTACMNTASCCNAQCVEPASDVTNCGSCGHVCAPTNVRAPACMAGSCGYDVCTAGFGDCDGDTTNGCETGTGNDLKNCGSCRNACMVPANATAACTAGTCAIGVCNVGFADCNKQVNDGCEVNTNIDLKNCGACGMACPALPNGQASCVAGKCGLASCIANFANCDNMPANGCEVNTTNDVKNCGSCGRMCAAAANQSVACVASVCKTTCNAGFGDCDGNPVNGCEVDLTRDPANCSACNSKCTLPNAVAGCAASACTVSSCSAGFGNCDNMPANGCEVNLNTTAAHCSKCGMACPNGQGCVMGACVNVFPAACSTDKDVSGAQYVVCAINQTGAWISGQNLNGMCMFSALNICKKYGFSRVTRWGGTCGTICGYCGAFTCQMPQGQFVVGAAYTNFDGGGGNPAGGANIGCTVHWECAP